MKGAAIQVEDVARRFGRRWALANITFDVPAGQGVMLTGHNGSGKSTLLRCLATALQTHHGEIRVDGESLWPNRHRIRNRLGMLSHAGYLYDDLSGAENLQIWARMANLRPDVPALLQRVGLPDRKEPMRTFSAGMRRRLALARLLLQDPDVVLLDEPYTALDSEGRDLVTSVAQELRGRGATLFMATHLTDYASACCDRHITLLDGQMIADRAASA